MGGRINRAEEVGEGEIHLWRRRRRTFWEWVKCVWVISGLVGSHDVHSEASLYLAYAHIAIAGIAGGMDIQR